MPVAAPRDLVGRDAERRRLVALLSGDRPVVVVGEAGIGKTALVRSAAAAAGRALREGGAFATLAWMPYLAIRRAVDAPVSGEPARVASIVERVVGPDLLFVDDLQWADRETRAAVALLAGRIGLVAAVRDGDPGTAGALDLLESNGGEVIRIGGLGPSSALAVARGVRPDLSERALGRIVARAGGNPLLIEELARQGRGSSSLTRAIAGQLTGLGQHEREVIELLALAEQPLPIAALGGAGRRLVERGLARQLDGRLEIRHALIAEAVVGAMAEETRRAHHGRLAVVSTDPAERARHLAAAGQAAEAARVALAALDGTSDPRARAALLTVAADTLDGADVGPVRVSAARELQGIGADDEAVRLLERPIDGPDELQALRVGLLAESLWRISRHEDARAELAAARALRPDPTSDGAVELALTEAAALVNIEGRPGVAIDILERMTALRATAGRPYRITGLLATLRLYAGTPGQVGDLEQAWWESLTAGDGATAAGLANNLLFGLLIERGASAAHAFALEAAIRLDQLGFVSRASALRVEAAQAALFAGDLRGSIVSADDLLEQPIGLNARERLFCHRGLALTLLGRFEDATTTFDEVEPLTAAVFDERGEVLVGRAELALWSGRPDRARGLAAAAIELPAVAEANYVLPALVRAWAELELGGKPSPLPTTPDLRVLAAAAPEHRGIAALAADDPVAALTAFEEAAGLWAAFHVPRELVCRWAAGEAARRAGLADRAAESLAPAFDRASEIGFEPLATRVRRSLRLLGWRVQGPRPDRSARGLLTSREREVLALVGRGLNNTEISRRMGLGRPTVARMLSNAMLKLGADSRAQAVALAAEMD